MTEKLLNKSHLKTKTTTTTPQLLDQEGGGEGGLPGIDHSQIRMVGEGIYQGNYQGVYQSLPIRSTQATAVCSSGLLETGFIRKSKLAGMHDGNVLYSKNCDLFI